VIVEVEPERKLRFTSIDPVCVRVQFVGQEDDDEWYLSLPGLHVCPTTGILGPADGQYERRWEAPSGSGLRLSIDTYMCIDN
jgi:hypothetical protein